MHPDSEPSIRLAPPGDAALTTLAGIEDAGAAIFAGHVDTRGWSPAPPGHRRADRPGFLLVAGDPPVGFAHVLDLDGHAHLDQVSVHPDHLRRGTGSALVRAAMVEAGARGHREMTLCTFADVPWNGPFYRQLGFREVDEGVVPASVRRLRDAERDLGLDDNGRRVVMRAALPTRPAEVRPAVSVIPLRDGPDGLEAFVQHRQGSMDFAAGAVVFPGGRCDPEDVAAGERLDVAPDVVTEHARRWQATGVDREDPPHSARTLLATGVRELREETGMVVAPGALLPWDRWVTPTNVPMRFDVAFYVLAVSKRARSQPRHLTTEATRSGWEPVDSLLAGLAAGRLTMLTPTRTIVEELLALGDVATVLAHRPAISAVRDDRPTGRPRPAGA